MLGHAAIVAVRALWSPESLERRYGVLTVRLTQVLTGWLLVRGGAQAWEAVTFCETVMRAKEVAEYDQELRASVSRPRRRRMRRTVRQTARQRSSGTVGAT